MNELDTAVLTRAQEWIRPPYDLETREEVKQMMTDDPEGLIDAFYKDLEFGTGGLRGVMGAGSNRMNQYTVGAATQGLANYIRKAFGAGEHGVAIAHDCRHNSRYFAEVASDILATNGLKVHLFDDLRPTPELSFAVRELGCKSGIVITASHNPPKYNGFKVYWEDGGQIVAPHDQGIIHEVRAITDQHMVLRGKPGHRIVPIGAEFDEAYLRRLASNVIEKEAIRKMHDLSMVYTSLHGTGITLVPRALEGMGFTNLHLVQEQSIPDGGFSTVESPNPEEAEALAMAIAKAREVDATIVMGTDPDTDRVGIAVREKSGSYRLFNGNDTGVLLTWYQLNRLKAAHRLPKNAFVARTIVTTPLLSVIADDYALPCYVTLTGFKHIAAVIREREPKEVFITGGEESYGYMIGDFVRDKDGVAAAAMIAEMTAWFATQGMSLIDALEMIHRKYGMYRELLVSQKRDGMKGAEEIKQMMEGFRNNPPDMLGQLQVVTLIDYLSGDCKDLRGGSVSKVDLPASNVIQFILEDGSVITARPSGTEPKIKFYFSVNAKVHGDAEELMSALESRLQKLKEELLSF